MDNREYFQQQVQEIRYRLGLLHQSRDKPLGVDTDLLDQALEDFNTTVEELQVAEEELRQQNEELIASRETIERERHRYQDLFDHAPDGYIVTDLNGFIYEANRAAILMLNSSPELITNSDITRYILPEDRKRFRQRMMLGLRISRLEQLEVKILPNQKDPFYAAISFNLMSGLPDMPDMLRWTIRDIDERVKAQEEVKRNEQRFRAIFRDANLGIVLINRSGQVIECNPALTDMLGYEPGELRQVFITKIFHPEEVEKGQLLLEGVLSGARENFNDVIRLLRKDGKTAWANLSVSGFEGEEGQDHYAIMLVEDVTARKQMQDTLDELRRRLVMGTELERQRLSQELHDGPLQDLYGIFYQLNSMIPDIKEEATLTEIKKTRDQLEEVINRLRMTSYELRPPALAHYGLAKALLSYSERFKQFYPGINIYLDMANDEHKLSEDMRLCLFRNYQQAMLNIGQHSKAHNVRITFNLSPGTAMLEIKDDGQGFSVPEQWISFARQGRLGLAGCAERAEALGGRLEVVSSPQEGTSMRTLLPYQPGNRVKNLEKTHKTFHD